MLAHGLIEHDRVLAARFLLHGQPGFKGGEVAWVRPALGVARVRLQVPILANGALRDAQFLGGPLNGDPGLQPLLDGIEPCLLPEGRR